MWAIGKRTSDDYLVYPGTVYEKFQTYNDKVSLLTSKNLALGTIVNDRLVYRDYRYIGRPFPVGDQLYVYELIPVPFIGGKWSTETLLMSNSAKQLADQIAKHC